MQVSISQLYFSQLTYNANQFSISKLFSIAQTTQFNDNAYEKSTINYSKIITQIVIYLQIVTFVILIIIQLKIIIPVVKSIDGNIYIIQLFNFITPIVIAKNYNKIIEQISKTKDWNIAIHV